MAQTVKCLTLNFGSGYELSFEIKAHGLCAGPGACLKFFLSHPLPLSLRPPPCTFARFLYLLKKKKLEINVAFVPGFVKSTEGNILKE